LTPGEQPFRARQPCGGWRPRNGRCAMRVADDQWLSRTVPRARASFSSVGSLASRPPGPGAGSVRWWRSAATIEPFSWQQPRFRDGQGCDPRWPPPHSAPGTDGEAPPFGQFVPTPCPASALCHHAQRDRRRTAGPGAQSLPLLTLRRPAPPFRRREPLNRRANWAASSRAPHSERW